MKYKHVLLVDDDQDDREIFCEALSEVTGAAMCTAVSDCTKAFQLLIDNVIEPDIIFLDLNMPRMNGQELLKGIRQLPAHTTTTVIIYTTMPLTESAYNDYQLEGATAVVSKPHSFTDVKKLLNNFLEI